MLTIGSQGYVGISDNGDTVLAMEEVQFSTQAQTSFTSTCERISHISHNTLDHYRSVEKEKIEFERGWTYFVHEHSGCLTFYAAGVICCTGTALALAGSLGASAGLTMVGVSMIPYMFLGLGVPYLLTCGQAGCEFYSYTPVEIKIAEIEERLRTTNEKNEVIENLAIEINQLAQFQEKWEQFKTDPQDFKIRALFDFLEVVVTLPSGCHINDWLTLGVAKLIFLEEYSRNFPASILASTWVTFKGATTEEHSPNSGELKIWEELGLMSPTKTDYTNFFGHYMQAPSISVVSYLDALINRILDAINQEDDL